MRVLTSDVKALLLSAIDKYENLHSDVPTLEKTDNKLTFFTGLTNHINSTTNSNIKTETLYKQYYIKLNSYTLKDIGYSVNYLNSLCTYIYQQDYLSKFQIIEEAEEIPEFPYDRPCFPATTCRRIKIDDHDNVWIKDESENPIGIHKDRMAWEVYLFYDRLLRENLLKGKRIALPRLSIISSGNAALSIQYLLQLKGLPNLKVIINKTANKKIVEALRFCGAEIYLYDLKTQRLNSDDILRITNNLGGYELTYFNGIEEMKFTLYDWLAYEILNLNPDYVFCPFGTGDLFSNILEINEKEQGMTKPSKRFFGNKGILSNCVFYGAATRNEKSKMTMLYTKYNTSEDNDLKTLLNHGHISRESKIVTVKEEFVEKALNLQDELGINAEPSGLAGLALFLEEKDRIPVDKKIIIVNTGRLKIELFKYQ